MEKLLDLVAVVETRTMLLGKRICYLSCGPAMPAFIAGDNQCLFYLKVILPICHYTDTSQLTLNEALTLNS